MTMSLQAYPNPLMPGGDNITLFHIFLSPPMASSIFNNTRDKKCREFTGKRTYSLPFCLPPNKAKKAALGN